MAHKSQRQVWTYVDGALRERQNNDDVFSGKADRVCHGSNRGLSQASDYARDVRKGGGKDVR